MKCFSAFGTNQVNAVSALFRLSILIIDFPRPFLNEAVDQSGAFQSGQISINRTETDFSGGYSGGNFSGGKLSIRIMLQKFHQKAALFRLVSRHDIITQLSDLRMTCKSCYHRHARMSS